MEGANVTVTQSVQDISKTNVLAEGYDKKCIFCRIVNHEVDTELLHCDEEISCFRDIKPGAPHHYLVVPTKHVGNCKSLRKEHLPLVKRMVEMGKEILQKNDVTDLNDVRYSSFLSHSKTMHGLGSIGPHSVRSHIYTFMFWHLPARWASCLACSTG
ncbi:histidine triad nucleotide-binding protein 3 isoform X2 [Phyllopteryx taeniolatus]|uniref:histidine triad nucleotide-binding protein 3 isoform X2 n=1 Tax=Phyllopteryx taeniolatus TaxID=161469 RepID=UPI002AD55F32|nr:histidine triad nucleotide-binding protein 3 isoform X2 [Phyllopteryx taeniolatus]